MKKLLTINLLTLLLLSGCDLENEITSSQDVNQKINWITLPTPAGLSIESRTFVNSEYINGSVGGHVMLVTEYQGGPFGIVKIDSKLEIKQNSFYGTRKLSTTCTPEEGLVKFGPTMSFNRDLEYTLVYEGIDLTGVNPETVKFCYITPDGSLVETENLGIQVDIGAGKIKVDKAFIPHFSRYGFVN